MADQTSALPFAVPAGLEPFADPVAVLVSKKYTFFPRPITHFIASALVFNPEGRLLTVQRSATDFGANLWEIPGGCVDPHESVLQGAARELFEEAGLKMVSVQCAVGPRAVPPAGAVVPAGEAERLSELDISGAKYDARAGQTFDDGNPAKDWVWCRVAFIVGVEDCGKVVLDPVEHQAYMWLTEEEVREARRGEKEIEFASEEMRAIMLEAFRVKRTAEVGSGDVEA
ncbi:hypothetical protein jhhlp_004754 [Lomentospora prolificans]|uniref:Nudix hydrolase domain-containing protein n=1 Tax=Lomentospora prolificans TaxID=41688 RepID=A0A2N3N8B5_9PEZI|nr:hypothetical protein jhhlp_004754 [Lomentospora prolificans]